MYQLRYIKVPRELITQSYADLSTDQVVLYSFLLNQMRQVPNKHGYFLAKDMRDILADMLNCKLSKINHLIPELERLGMIDTKHLPGDNGIRIYNGKRGLNPNSKNYIPYPTALFSLHFIGNKAKFAYALLMEKVNYSTSKYNQPYMLYGSDRLTLASILGCTSDRLGRYIAELKQADLIQVKKTTRGVYISSVNNPQLDYHFAKFNDTILQKITELYNYRYNTRDKVNLSVDNTLSREDKPEVISKPTNTPKSYIPNPKQIRDKFSSYVAMYPMLDANLFYKHYNANGWMIGNSPIRYWDKVADKWIAGTYVPVPANVMTAIHKYWKMGIFPEDIRQLMKRDNSDYFAFLNKKGICDKNIKPILRIGTIERIKEFTHIK